MIGPPQTISKQPGFHKQSTGILCESLCYLSLQSLAQHGAPFIPAPCFLEAALLLESALYSSQLPYHIRPRQQGVARVNPAALR